MAIKSNGGRCWSTRNGTDGHDSSGLPRCCATAKSTGRQCRLPAKKGRNFCGIHAGKYRPGRKKGTPMPIKHGLYTEQAFQERKEARDLLRALNGLIGVMNQETQRLQGAAKL